MSKIIELKNINHYFHAFEESLHVLKDINLTINKGEIIAIVGKSGSGKSTLLNVLAAFINPEEGEMKILDETIFDYDDEKLASFRREHLGFIFQSYNLIPSMSAIENVQLPLEIAGVNRDERYNMAGEILKILGLDSRKNYYANALSGGEQQRVAIGRAIITNPSIILADEPTGNLDSKSGKEVLECLFKINKDNNTTMILVTHDEDLAKMADRIIRIKDGRIINHE
ncbi:MAG: ABC transporter ATP-binding protein [Clostridium sp.]